MGKSLLRFWLAIRMNARMAWAMLKDPRVPGPAKLVVIAAIVYLVVPFDVLSDVVPVLGWLDDALVVSALLWLAARFVPDDINRALRERARQRAVA